MISLGMFSNRDQLLCMMVGVDILGWAGRKGGWSIVQKGKGIYPWSIW